MMQQERELSEANDMELIRKGLGRKRTENAGS